jgi:hypothetical protein
MPGRWELYIVHVLLLVQGPTHAAAAVGTAALAGGAALVAKVDTPEVDVTAPSVSLEGPDVPKKKSKTAGIARLKWLDLSSQVRVGEGVLGGAIKPLAQKCTLQPTSVFHNAFLNTSHNLPAQWPGLGAA